MNAQRSQRGSAAQPFASQESLDKEENPEPEEVQMTQKQNLVRKKSDGQSPEGTPDDGQQNDNVLYNLGETIDIEKIINDEGFKTKVRQTIQLRKNQIEHEKKLLKIEKKSTLFATGKEKKTKS